MTIHLNICQKCSKDCKKLRKKLVELDVDFSIKVGCQSQCKLGKKKEFVIVEKKQVVTAKTIKKVVSKVKKEIA